MTFGLTPQGYKPKRLQDIRNDQDEKSKELFGEDINLEESSSLKRFNDVQADELADIYNDIENIFNALDARKATNQQQDNLYNNANVPRRLAKSSVGVATFSGTDTTIIPVGTIIETANKIQFRTTEQGIIDSGSVDLAIEALIQGVGGDVGSGLITVIVTRIIGLNSVTNAAATAGGQDKEKDEIYRERYFDSIGTDEEEATERVRVEVLKQAGVISATVTENYEDVEVGGIPPKSFLTVVQGGTNTDVATAIFKTKPMGIRPDGTTTVLVENSQGVDITIKFTRPTEVTIYVVASVTLNSLAAVDALETIKQNLIDHINQLDVGEDVVYNQLIGIVTAVQGVEDVTMTIGKTANPTGTSNIAILPLEKAVTTTNEVDVT